MIIKYYYFPVILMLFICGCSHDESHNIFTTSNFPIKIGNYWRYHRVGDIDMGFTFSHYDDTFMVKVMDVSISNNQSQRLRLNYYSNGKLIDSSTWYMRGDTVSSYSFLNSFFADMRFIFPIKQNSRYRNTFGTDTMTCRSYTGGYIENGKTYRDVFYLQSRYPRDSNGKECSTDYFIARDIGIIEIDKNFTGGLSAYDEIFTATLIDYIVY